MSRKSVHILGIVCGAVVILIALVTSRYVGARLAIKLATAGATPGIVLGCCLAGITRTKSASAIYLLLIIAGLCLWPLGRSWPEIALSDLASANPDVLLKQYNALEAMRFLTFILAIPYPYAAVGQHAADSREPETEATNMCASSLHFPLSTEDATMEDQPNVDN